MTHKITIVSNPRILIVFFVAIALPVGGVLLTFLFNFIIGIVVILVGGFIAHHLIKFGVANLKSWVRTGEDSITICASGEEPLQLLWEQITHAGLITQAKMRDQAYVYAEGSDKLFTIPSEYSNFERLVSSISENLPKSVPFEAVELDQTETITDYLKERVSPPEEDGLSDDVPEGEVDVTDPRAET